MNFELNKQNKENPDKHYEAQTAGPPPPHYHSRSYRGGK